MCVLEGALPAQHGYSIAGIVEIQTKNGKQLNGVVSSNVSSLPGAQKSTGVGCANLIVRIGASVRKGR
jgi:hypothetical protein